MIARPFDVSSFASAEQAQTWLAVDAPLETLLADIRTAGSGTTPLVREVRTRIGRDLLEPNAAAVARSLGLSQRTLQRRLAKDGTSFRNEVATARVEAAKQMLASSAAPIKIIALDVGFATPQHFSTAFRRVTGAAPTAWREARSGRSAPSPAPDRSEE